MKKVLRPSGGRRGIAGKPRVFENLRLAGEDPFLASGSPMKSPKAKGRL